MSPELSARGLVALVLAGACAGALAIALLERAWPVFRAWVAR